MSANALRARIAAHSLHASRDSRTLTENARKAFLARFEREVDPNGELPEPERTRRAAHARTAYMCRLALRSAAVRRARATDRELGARDGTPE
jgi:hypothetical protein